MKKKSNLGLKLFLWLITLIVLTSAAFTVCFGDESLNPEISDETYIFPMVGASGTSGNIKWSTSAGVLTLSGTGTMKDFSTSSKAPWYTYRSSITSVVVESGVTSIGEYAFYGCKYITEITMADSVTSIGGHAFYNCSAIAKIPIPDSVTTIGSGAFYNCDSLTDMTIPDSVTSLGSSAFSACDGLISVKLSSGMTAVEDFTFSGCLSLTDVTLPASIISVGDNTFQKCTALTSISLPDSLTSIGDSAFYKCTGLTSLTIPDSVTSLGTSFIDSSGITSITIPKSVTDFEYTLNWASGNKATAAVFNGAESLKQIIVGEGTMEIHSGMFALVPEGTEIIMPDSVTKIDQYAFVSSGNISLELPESLTEIEYYAFRHSGITDIILPDSLTKLDYYAFYSCASLESITLSKNLKYIYEGAFYKCTSLKSIDIPAKVKGIDYYAFYYCSSLETISLPLNVTVIGIDSYAFRYCSSLTSVYFGGSEEDRENMYISDTYNSCLTDAQWYYNSDLAAKDDGSVNENGTFYTVTYDARGVAEIEPEKVEEYDFAPRPGADMSRSGYTFLGWYNGSEAYDFTMEVTSDLTLTAKWKVSETIVAGYDSDGRTVHLVGEEFTLSNSLNDSPTSLVWTYSSDEFRCTDNYTSGNLASITLAGRYDGTFTVTLTRISTVYPDLKYEIKYNIRIVNSLTSISVEKPVIYLTEGGAAPLNYTTSPDNNYSRILCNFEITSSDTNVAYVDDEGIINAVGEGAAILTLSADNNLTAYCLVIVSSSFAKGDANGDGSVDITDAIHLLESIEKSKAPGLSEYTDDYMEYLDFDGNGELDKADAAYILHLLIDNSL